MAIVKIKRIYEPSSTDDGYRILVDRLWPRGLKKENANIDSWMKDVTPSTALRTWFGQDPPKWHEFSKLYSAELKSHPEAVKELVDCIKKHKVATLLYAAKDEHHTHALVLQQYVKPLLK